MILSGLLQLVTVVPLLQLQAGVQRFHLLAQGCSLQSHLLHLHMHTPGTLAGQWNSRPSCTGHLGLCRCRATSSLCVLGLTCTANSSLQIFAARSMQNAWELRLSGGAGTR